MNTLIATLSMGGLGLFFASLLAVVSRKLKIKIEPKIAALEEALPGINCGACGFTGCHQYAEALAGGKAGPDECKPGGEKTAKALSAILGVAFEKKTKEIAIVHCGADTAKRKKKAEYAGIKTCLAADGLFGGENLCAYGCLGYGDCAAACPFGAIQMVDGLPRVDKDKCTGCGKCRRACPRGIITIEKMESHEFVYVACNSRDKGANTRKICSVGCIGCGLCQKLTGGVFYVEDNLARVDNGKIPSRENYKQVLDKCPTKCILSEHIF